MDLLAGYGSGSESDSDGGVRAGPSSPGAHHMPPPGRSTAAVAPPARAGGLFNSLPKPKNNPTSGNKTDASASGLPAGFFDAVPAEALDSAQEAAPSGLPVGFFDAAPPAVQSQGLSPNGVTQKQASEDAAAPLFSKLPAASKRKVLLLPQIDLQLLAQQSDSDEDEPVAKKVKAAAPAAGKASVLSFLPAPKHTAGKRVDSSAGSSGFAEAAQQRQQQQQQQREAATAAAAAASVGPQAPAGNEAYRLRPSAPAAADTYHHDHHEHHHQQQYYSQHEQQYDQYASHGYAAAAESSAMQQQQPQRYQQLPPEEAFLQEALQAEASKAARRTAGAGSSQLLMPDIQFKEVRADEVKYVDPAQREAAQGMRSALGTDYAQQLRSQAAPHTGSKLARSKHQIGTLFANAKLRELEVMENRASGMKSKAETAGKYGW